MLVEEEGGSLCGGREEAGTRCGSGSGKLFSVLLEGEGRTVWLWRRRKEKLCVVMEEKGGAVCGRGGWEGTAREKGNVY